MKKKVVTVSVTVTRGCSEGVCVTVTARVTTLLKEKNATTQPGYPNMHNSKTPQTSDVTKPHFKPHLKLVQQPVKTPHP